MHLAITVQCPAVSLHHVLSQTKPRSGSQEAPLEAQGRPSGPAGRREGRTGWRREWNRGGELLAAARQRQRRPHCQNLQHQQTGCLAPPTLTPLCPSHTRRDTWTEGHRPDWSTQATAAHWQAIHSVTTSPVMGQSQDGPTAHMPRSLHTAERIWWVEARWWKHHDLRVVFYWDTSVCVLDWEKKMSLDIYEGCIFRQVIQVNSELHC